MVNNLVFRWPKPLFFHGLLGAHGTRCFKPWPFYPLIGGHCSPLERSINHPTKVTESLGAMIPCLGCANRDEQS